MSVKIFRNDNWSRIKNGVISRRDIVGLDRERDKELIGYLIFHAPEACRLSVIKHAEEKYGMTESPMPLVNTDDPEDTFFWEYAVLREQVVREEDTEVLKAAVNSPDHGIAAFAFCRLTGYSFTPGGCDAYSYRNFECGILPCSTDEMIYGLCRSIIEEGGRFADVAKECLRDKKADRQ